MLGSLFQWGDARSVLSDLTSNRNINAYNFRTGDLGLGNATGKLKSGMSGFQFIKGRRYAGEIDMATEIAVSKKARKLYTSMAKQRLEQAMEVKKMRAYQDYMTDMSRAMIMARTQVMMNQRAWANVVDKQKASHNRAIFYLARGDMARAWSSAEAAQKLGQFRSLLKKEEDLFDLKAPTNRVPYKSVLANDSAVRVDPWDYQDLIDNNPGANAPQDVNASIV